MPQTSSLFLLGVGDDINWETVVPEKRQKQQWGGSVPSNSHVVLTGFACHINGTYKWNPRNVHGSWGSLSEAEVLHDRIGIRRNYYHC